MGLAWNHSAKKMFAQLILLALPTSFLAAFVMYRLNHFYSILNNDWFSQGLYFALGCILSVFLFAFRLRFITVTALVFFINYAIYLGLQRVNYGEFDGFYVVVRYYIFIVLFSAGWVVGYAFSRSRLLTIVWSALLLVTEIVLLAKTTEINASALINGIVPALVYSFYILYTAELIRNLNEDEKGFGWFIGKRLAVFTLLLFLLFVLIFGLFEGRFKAVEKEWAGSAPKEQKEGNNNESMTKKNPGGGVENKDQSRLAGSLNKDKELVFVARLDNYFPNSSIPNPLYFTSHYFSKFDTATQTFERDDNIPFNDLFKPDPSQIPLYFKKNDTSVIRRSLATRNRKVVSADVYKVALSASAFVAPSTAFYCQPISVPKEFQQHYKSAYTTKMWVSELNSAYFIYNPGSNKELQKFQEMRFEALREIDEITGPDKAFMEYYTYMPRSEDYDKIGELAHKITRDFPKPIDKIIALRDYFLSKDQFNQPLFAYSDNPGIPGLPSANKLTYFLLENRKGYCAYFAGATLFMLRSLGIPSRVVVGYSATDRSSKNPGWYWFYQDQAHAWVQVYFQEFGWIDFDTTVPDVNTQQAPQPDGTPPPEIPKNYLVADGEVISADTTKKLLLMRTRKILYHDSEFVSTATLSLPTDVSLATISNDTGHVKLKDLKPGTHITAVSHAEVLKSVYIKRKDSLQSILKRLPSPVPVDEIKVMTVSKPKNKTPDKKKEQDKPFNWLHVLYWSLAFAGGLLLLLLSLPGLCWWWLHSRAKRNTGLSRQAYNAHRAADFYLQQMGYAHEHKNPAIYALSIDKKFGTGYEKFNALYQKLKYSTVQLSEEEAQAVKQFYAPFIKTVSRQIPLKEKLKNFLNVYRTFNFFIQTK